MKKIISLISALAVATSLSTAFAAIPSDAGENAKASVTITNTGVEEYGYTVYNMEVDLSELGTLNHVAGIKPGGTKITQFDLVIESTNVVLKEIVSASMDTSLFTNSGDSTEKGGIFVSYASTAAAKAYPTSGTTTVADNAVVVAFYGMPNETVNIGQTKVGYATFAMGNMQGITEYLPIVLAGGQTTFTLPASGSVSSPVESAGLSLKLKEDADVVSNERGMAWNLDLTLGEGDIESFSATFAKGSDSITRTTNAVSAISSFEGEGTINFWVGLKFKNATAVDSASFTITDDASATSTETWSNN